MIFSLLHASTLVETAEGLKPIEEIREGDLVLAYDEQTGEQAYKPVVQLFRNETTEWYHIRASAEEIICTGGHPFYVLNAAAGREKVNYEGCPENAKGTWICANELRSGDELLLADGTIVAIEAVTAEKLSEPETTYNFEVADSHTYYVSDCKVLVHNDCVSKARKKAVNEAWKQERELVAKTGKGTRQWTDAEKLELLKRGKVKGYEGHHINSVKGSLAKGGDVSLISNPNNVAFVTRSEHLMMHSGNFRNVTTGELLSRVV